MDVSFRSKKLEKTCSSERELIKAYGTVCARKIRARLDDLVAARTLQDFRTLPGRCHELKGDRNGQLSLDLEHPLRLIFEPTSDGAQTRKDDGGLDWTAIDAVQIIGVEDTHE